MPEDENQLNNVEEEGEAGASRSAPGRIIYSFRQLSRPKQIAFSLLGAGVVVFIILLASYLLRPQYVPLFTGLESQQASMVMEQLRERGVSYRLEDGGLTITVPEDEVYELRIALAGERTFYAQDMGFELFDTDGLGMSDFERQVRYQRALQEELRRTIVSLQAVDQARVHLVMPEPSVFLRETSEPTASVYLSLSPFMPLEEKQVQGIVHLVAGSVENLTSENVVLIDSQGNILHDSMTAMDPSQPSAEATIKQLEIKRTFEQELEKRVQNMLERVFGPGKALALVSAEMDFDSRERTILTFEENGVPRSSQIIEEYYEGEGPIMEEVGEPNIPGYVAPFAGGDMTYERTEEIFNYEIGETLEREISAPGRILRLNTSVVVDDEGEPLTPQEMAQVENLVASAIGFDPERGDLINIEGMTFDVSHIEQMEAAMLALEEEEAARRQLMMQAAAIGAGLLLLLLLIVLFMRRRRRRAAAEDIEAEEIEPGPTIEELLGEEEDDSPMVQEDTGQKKVKKLVEDNPEVAAHVLKTWIVED